MTEALADLDRGLDNLLFHVGVETIRRGEEDYSVSATPLSVLVRLLVERGAAPDVRERLRPVLREGDHAVWEWVYTHGEPTGRTPVEPGQLVVWRHGARTHDGIVIEADRGRPTQIVTAGSRIRLAEDPVDLEQVEEVWSLSVEPRAHDPRTAKFYGDPSALFDLVSRMWVLSFDNVRDKTFVYNGPVGLAGSLARSAPETLRDRIWAAESLAEVREAVGAGEYEAGSVVPVGAWCFLGRSALTVVLSTTPDGVPVVGLTHAEHLRIERVPLDNISALWVPDT